MTTALITGCAGFIGSNLADRCIAAGWAVTGVDDLSNGHMQFVSDPVDFYGYDFTADAVVDRIRAQEFDVVVHLAATPRVSYSVEHPLETHDNNVTRTLALINACRGNVKRFVFASSSSVYGGADVLPTHESAHKRPKSPYALQKLQVEEYLELYRHLYGLDSVSLRFFNVFGPAQVSGGAYATAMSSWLNAIKKGLPMRSDGDGSQSRDLCYIDNVTQACMKACTVELDPQFRVFNVACGKAVTNRAVLKYLLQRYPGSTYVDAPWRSGDVMHTLADISLSETILSYQPEVSAWDGIKRTCDWFDDNWPWVKDLKQGM